jgi:hypothetical protein
MSTVAALETVTSAPTANTSAAGSAREGSSPGQGQRARDYPVADPSRLDRARQSERRTTGRLTLVEALELTALVSRDDTRRRSRYAARWLTRWLAETPTATLEDATAVVAYLGELGGPRHAEVVASLREIAGRE